MKRILITTVLSLLLAVTVWRFTCPALVRVRFGIFAGSTHLLILNPIRSSAANRTAISFLEALQSGDASDVSKRFPMIEKNLVKDGIFPRIRDWVLDDVVSDPNGGFDFEYMYSQRASGSMEGGYIWVYCVKRTDGAWTVRTFNRVY